MLPHQAAFKPNLIIHLKQVGWRKKLHHKFCLKRAETSIRNIDLLVCEVVFLFRCNNNHMKIDVDMILKGRFEVNDFTLSLFGINMYQIKKKKLH